MNTTLYSMHLYLCIRFAQEHFFNKSTINKNAVFYQTSTKVQFITNKITTPMIFFVKLKSQDSRCTAEQSVQGKIMTRNID